MALITCDVETSGLAPELGDFTTAIGILDPNGMRIHSAPANIFRINSDEAERQVLQSFSSSKFNDDDILITYNGIKFDEPFLKERYAKTFPNLNVPLPKKHIDLMLFAKHLNKGVFISKDYAALKFADIYIPKTISGALLARIYAHKVVTDEQHVKMQQHLALDLVATWQLFNTWKVFPDFRKSCLDNFKIDLDAIEVI